MIVKLDGTARLVIPKCIRKALDLDAYSEIKIELVEKKIIISNPKKKK